MKKYKLEILIYFIIISITIFKINEVKTIDVSNAQELKQSNYHILIDVEESKMYVFNQGNLIKMYSCAGGKKGTPSPIGTWKITSKALWGEGYGGRFMGLNCQWGQFGIHGTNAEHSIGSRSSHGCIRMKTIDVEELYKFIPIGTKVTIVDGPYGNFGHGFRYLESGMYGSDVYEIQKKLYQLGFLKSEPSGKFGSQTEKAIQEYCKANALKVRKTIDIELQKYMGFVLIE